MKSKVYLGIVGRVVLLFTVCIFTTFIPDHFRVFFGDKLEYHPFGIDREWSWGVRHYWYYSMMVILFIVSVIDTVMSIVSLIKKHYPE